MKSVQYLTIISSAVIFLGCQQNKPGNLNQTNPAVTATEAKEDDARAKDQRYFLSKIQAESDYDVTSNSIKKDSHIETFNKYAKDTLKEFKGWEFIVTEINDYSNEASTVAKLLGLDSNPIYNLKVVAPIKIDHSVDTIAIDNRVDFTYSIPKSPDNANLKQQLSIIKTLNKGDTIIVDGAVTHLDDQGKINYASFYDQYLPWDVDLMITQLRKK